MKRVLLVVMLFALAGLAACGGGKSTPTQPEISVSVLPTTVSVMAGQTQQFTATVSGTTNTSVTWSLSGTGCSGNACGTIDPNGMYKAPSPIPAAATVTIVATAAANSSKQGTATVTHMPIVVTVTPATLSLISADTKQFAATVTNVPSGGNSGVTWSATGGGAIDTNGLYSAPAKVVVDTSVTVTATSQFDTTKSFSVNILIKALVITVSPDNIQMDAGGVAQRFVASVSNAPAGQTGVTWYLNGLGTLDSSGMYHSPMLVSSAASDIVQAVPLFDNSKVGKATVHLSPLVLTVAPRTATLYAGQSEQFTAAVVNHVNKSLSWSVAGSNCAGAACGTVDANGLYTAPSSIATDLTVSVTVNSLADTSKSDSATISLIPVKVTVSPKTATLSLNATQQFSATVTGTTNQNVTWSVSGSGCSGNACGTISATGLYTAPNTVPGSSVTVTAAAVADPTKSDTATVAVSPSLNSKLAGPYAFSYVGYDAAGKALYVIGSFVADGNGSLSGLMDTNGTGAGTLAIKTSFTGSYEVAASGNRGQATFNLPTVPFTFRFALNPAGDKGYMIRFDNTGNYGSGTFKRQTASDFLLTRISGDYVLALTGTSQVGDERNAAVGRLHTDGNGAISDTSVDVSSGHDPSINMTFTGSLALNASTGAANGRGTMAESAGSNGTLNFSFYMVTKDEAFVLSVDATSLDVPLLAGVMVRQTGGPFSNASFTGDSVFYLVGVTGNHPPTPSVQIGQFHMNNGVGSATYSRNWTGMVTIGGNFDVNATIAANGRGTWASYYGGPYVFYMVAPNTGYLLQTDNPSVLSGFFEPQTGGPFTTATLNGEFYGGALLATSSGSGYGTGIQTWDGSGGWTGTGDVAGVGVGTVADLAVAGTYSITNSGSGAGNWLQTSPSAYPKAIYVVSPKKILFISSSPTVTYPSFEIFEK